jgi:hypothetical protein
MMALTLRPTGLGSGIDKDRPEAMEGVGEDGRGAVKSTVIWIAVSFPIVLTASWWLLGSTVPGILLYYDRRCHLAVALDREARPR